MVIKSTPRVSGRSCRERHEVLSFKEHKTRVAMIGVLTKRMHDAPLHVKEPTQQDDEWSGEGFGGLCGGHPQWLFWSWSWRWKRGRNALTEVLDDALHGLKSGGDGGSNANHEDDELNEEFDPQRRVALCVVPVQLQEEQLRQDERHEGHTKS